MKKKKSKTFSKKLSKDKDKKMDSIDTLLERYEYQGPTKESKLIKPKKKPLDSAISLRLPSDVLERTRLAAEEKGMGYHTLIRLILMEHLKEYESAKHL